MKFKRYLKKKTLLFLFCFLIFLLLTVSFVLYQLPVRAVMYPMGLGLLLLLVYLMLDYRTEKKRDEELAEMEKQIQDLQQELLDEQAKAQQRMDYYTVWAHQIKTPIAAMRLNLQGQDSALCRRLGIDLNRVENYADMVMTYLRLDADGTDYVFEEKDIDEVVRGAIRKFSGEFIARKIELVYEPLNQIVLTDEKWLSFVIEQILSNALKYTTSGTISIYMCQDALNSEDADSCQATEILQSSYSPDFPDHAAPSGKASITNILCIRDTGIGIAPEDLPRIFDQGFTGYNGRTDKKASGLGLYLCKRICDNLGYRIFAESSPGKGTAIYLNMEKKTIEGNR